jgi:hypothetical protein
MEVLFTSSSPQTALEILGVRDLTFQNLVDCRLIDLLKAQIP